MPETCGNLPGSLSSPAAASRNAVFENFSQCLSGDFDFTIGLLNGKIDSTSRFVKRSRIVCQVGANRTAVDKTDVRVRRFAICVGDKVSDVCFLRAV